LKWERGNIRSRVSSNALQGGKDSDGSLIYVGRALHSGVKLPAKVIPSKNACYVSYNGKEILVDNFEVLTHDARLAWEPQSDGRVAEGAVSSGREGNEELFIGRAPFQGSMTIGKIHPSHRCLYFPYNGKEERATHYEVLVYKKPKAQWQPTTSTSLVPKDAIIGGRDTDGAQIYVGRASHEGDLLPCKVIPSKKVAYVAYNGSEITKHNYEILVGGDLQWTREKNGKVPQGAFPAGRTKQGETLFIGRVDHNRSQTIGKVHQTHGCLYIPYGGKELSFKEYEVLVEK